MSQPQSPNVVKGTVVDVSKDDEHGRAEVTLTVKCEDDETFTESYDMSFNMARAQDFAHNYGPTPLEAEGIDVNVYTGDTYNHRHVLRSYPLKTIGGDVLVSEGTDLPVAMS
jgi:hypothetical protein